MDKNNYKFKVNGFTLSEVLITLVIIGVVAAITVPMLMNNTNDKQWNVAKQKAQATIGEAFRLATINGDIDKNKTTEEFVNEILAKKYLKIAKSCIPSKSKECGFSEKMKGENNKETALYTTWTTATRAFSNSAGRTIDTSSEVWENAHIFQTIDGYSVSLLYNPTCSVSAKERNHKLLGGKYFDCAFDAICFNAVYDMNGAKGPNVIGKDIGFVGSFYNSYETKAIAVLPYKEKMPTARKWQSAYDYCKNLDGDNWILPDIDELSLLYLNHMMLTGERSQITGSTFYWSRTGLSNSPELAVGMHLSYGDRNTDTKSLDRPARCVRNNALK